MCGGVKNFCKNLEVDIKSLSLQKTSEFFRVYLLSSFYICRVPWGGDPADFYILHGSPMGVLKIIRILDPVFEQMLK